MHDTHTALLTMTIPQSWSSLIGVGAGRAPRERGNYIPKMARWAQRTASYTMPPPLFRRGMGCLRRRELWNSFRLLINSPACHWQTLAGFLRRKSATTLVSMQIVMNAAAYAKVSKRDQQQKHCHSPSNPPRLPFCTSGPNKVVIDVFHLTYDCLNSASQLSEL